MVDDAYAKRLHDKIQPDNVVAALVRAGALLTGYELVKTAIVDEVKGFFLQGSSEDGLIYSEHYEQSVLTLGRNVFDASVNWLIQIDALTQKQVDALEAIRSHRHEIAHELARFIVDPDADVSVDRLAELQEIMRSLDRFWGGVNVDTNPDFDGVDLDRDHIVSGSGALLTYLLQIAGVEASPDVSTREP
ncbi:helicase subunit of the DNA excision repair complex [Microbacterium testaceum StLB037]|uniref:Helicase subunit of the DNA excision repair complex n=1 Tax=Microbacterium testaceum (strain StLB037) TaxID=979556 RepID=E8N9G4_MICTS|nr:hypothetical protein [Microbacterium testaceum]BAJ73211.1 helicase subunit of the DNA excision repair complex [Microbacterium testaceum StLB037]